MIIQLVFVTFITYLGRLPLNQCCRSCECSCIP